MSPPSNRQRRRLARDGARALRARPGWDPAGFHREGEAERSSAAARTDEAAALEPAAAACPACRERRAELGDETALCDEHFAALMG